VSELGVGTATFAPGYGLGGSAAGPAAAAALLRDAIAAGIRDIDSAAGYGSAEAIVGEVADDIAGHGVRVCTKVTAEAVRANGALPLLRESLAALRLPRLDTLLLHSAAGGDLTDGALAARLREARESGLVSRTGASTYGVQDAALALGQEWCHTIQLEHSVINPSVLKSVDTGSARAEIVARSVLCKGLLSERRRHAGAIASGLEPTLRALEQLAAQWGWSLPELAIRYALDTPGVDVVVVGISTPAELDVALKAAARPRLDADALAALARFDRSADDAAHPERWPTPVQGA
jgi:aryl-alcohol dehydrogenase-like predicted oxidoreductase